MRVEVHVHGNVLLQPGIILAQLDEALRPWLDYFEVETIAQAKSANQDEPGIVFDPKTNSLTICWTGEADRNFRQLLEPALYALCPFTQAATEIEVSYYYLEDEQEEFGVVFVGPSAEAIHDAQRKRMTEDVAHLLARQFDQGAIEEVVTLVNQLFARSWAERAAAMESGFASGHGTVPPERKYLH